MEIRKAESRDAQGLAKLYLQFWDSHKNCDPLLELKRIPSLESEIKAAKKDIKSRNTCIFIAEKRGTVIGFIEILIKRVTKYPPSRDMAISIPAL